MQVGAFDGFAQRGSAQGQQRLEQHIAGGALRQGLQAVKRLLGKALVAAPGMRIDHLAAAQGLAGGGPAQDVVVAAHGDDGFFQLELQPALLAGQQLFAAQQAHARQDFGGAGKQLGFAVVLERQQGVGQQPEGDIQALRGAVSAGVGDDIAALDFLQRDAGDIDRRAAAGDGALFFALVGLQAAHPPAQPGGQDFDFVADVQAAIDQRAGDHAAKTGDGEDAVDRQARPVQIQARRALRQAWR